MNIADEYAARMPQTLRCPKSRGMFRSCAGGAGAGRFFSIHAASPVALQGARAMSFEVEGALGLGPRESLAAPCGT